uniref:Tektin n=1 Tax=Strigamia maritima TaxID=126957 RepID=T1J0B4_STRMM
MTCPGRKPNNRISPNEWYDKLFQDLKAAEVATENTTKYREKIERQLDSLKIEDLETDNDKNTELTSRINDTAGWIRKLKKVYNHVELEIELLSAAKTAAEMSLQNKSVPHDVNKFCLILRDRRAAYEAVQDTVEEELRREAKLIEAAKATLSQKCNQSFDLICQLKAMHNEIRVDLQEKRTSMSMDCNQISSKTKQIQPELMLPQVIKGEEEMRAMKTMDRIKNAEAIMNFAQVVRDDIYKEIVKTEDAILNHKQKTDYEYHKRMHEIGIALEELQWQKKNIEDEMESLNDLLQNLQDSLESKTNKLKVIETRIETTPIDKCSEAYQTLNEEGTRLRTLQKSLQKSMANTKGKINGLKSTLHVIENNLRDKLITQQLDQACMEERKK